MEPINQLTIHHFLVLNSYFQSICDIHYPRELVQLILKLYYKLTKISVHIDNNTYIIQIGTKVYRWSLLNPTSLVEWGIPPVNKLVIRYDDYLVLGSDSLLYIRDENNLDKVKVHSWYDGFEIKYLKDIKKIDMGFRHMMALDKSGKVYAWGNNQFGQLAQMGINRIDIPIEINLPPIKKIACGAFHSLALDFNGKVWAWGRADDGQVGTGFLSVVVLPQKLNLENIRNVYCGGYHSMAINNLGEVYVWGHNEWFKLGLGHQENKYLPTKLNLTPIKTIACGVQTLALDYQGIVYGWGYGVLGLDHIISPQKIDLPKAKYIACNNNFAVVTETNDIHIWKPTAIPNRKFTFGPNGLYEEGLNVDC